MSEDKKQEITENPKSAKEAIYSVQDLAAASEAVFGAGIMPECVIAAMAGAGLDTATKKQAVEIVKKFLKAEVK